MRVLLLASLMLSASALAAAPWSGESAGFKVSITEKNLLVQNAKGEKVLSLQDEYAKAVEEFEPAMQSETNWDRRIFIPLSLVGPYLTLRLETAGDAGGTHPYGSVSFVTYDLRNLSKTTSLSALFNEKDLVAGLRRDPVLEKHLPPKAKVRTLKELEAAFSEKTPEDCSIAFGTYSLESFAFYALEPKDQVAVRIALGPSCAVLRGSFTQLGLLLEVPSSLAAPLKAAAEGKQGFLMKDAPRLFGKTAITYCWNAPEDECVQPHATRIPRKVPVK